MIQWERLRQYSLLADQTVQPLNLGDSVLNFSDVEEQVCLAVLYSNNVKLGSLNRYFWKAVASCSAVNIHYTLNNLTAH